MESLLEQDLGMLKKQEDKFVAIFGNQTLYDRGFQVYKLKLLAEIAAKHAGFTTPEDKMLLEMIRVERRRLERQVYPNIVRRLLLRAKLRFWDIPKLLRKEEMNQSASSENLYNLARSSQPYRTSDNLPSLDTRASHLDSDKNEIQIQLARTDTSTGHKTAQQTTRRSRQRAPPNIGKGMARK